MSHVFYTKLNLTRKVKNNFFAYRTWRTMYLISLNSIHQTSEKRIYSRGSTLPITFQNYSVMIHSGKRWHKKIIKSWMVGFKAGEFTWNRRFALYKAKQLRKKKKKK